MSQQIFNQWSPVVKAHDENNQEAYIPFAGIHAQSRDGKDEIILGASNMQWDESSKGYLPTNKDNPLETRVRELEKLIGEITANPAANTLQDRLKVLADRLGEAVAEPSEHTLLARVRQLEQELAGIKSTLTDGTQKVTLTGQIALGDEQVTVEEDDVKSLSPPQGATVAYITVSDGAVRYRIGADPTGTLGHRANGDDDIVLASAEDIAAFRVTNDVDQSYSTIFVTYSGAVS